MNHPTRHRLYRVSPWRRSVLWWIFGPCLLGCLIAILAGGDDTREVAIVLGFFPAAGLAFWHWLMNFTRLELSAEGVRLRQVGYTLQASWSDIESIRLDKGREGFITRAPMVGKGADRLARLRFTGMRGVPLYDAEQQELLEQRRFIPIEAFAWHLRKGRPLGADIAGFAPHLALSCSSAPIRRPTSALQQHKATRLSAGSSCWKATVAGPRGNHSCQG